MKINKFISQKANEKYIQAVKSGISKEKAHEIREEYLKRATQAEISKNVQQGV